MMPYTCNHPNMRDTARMDYCPDCGYAFYYGDAHAPNSKDRESRLVNPGDDKSPDTLNRLENKDA